MPKLKPQIGGFFLEYCTYSVSKSFLHEEAGYYKLLLLEFTMHSIRYQFTLGSFNLLPREYIEHPRETPKGLHSPCYLLGFPTDFPTKNQGFYYKLLQLKVSKYSYYKGYAMNGSDNLTTGFSVQCKYQVRVQIVIVQKRKP